MYFAYSRPGVPVAIDRPPAEVEAFLERVWRRYARISVERLTTLVTTQPVYRKVAAQGEGEVIPFKAVLASRPRSAGRPERTQAADGRTIQKWMPRKAAPRETWRQAVVWGLPSVRSCAYFGKTNSTGASTWRPADRERGGNAVRANRPEPA